MHCIKSEFALENLVLMFSQYAVSFTLLWLIRFMCIQNKCIKTSMQYSVVYNGALILIEFITSGIRIKA